MLGAEVEQCAVRLVFTESSCGVTGKMGQNTKGDFESQTLSTSLAASRQKPGSQYHGKAGRWIEKGLQGKDVGVCEHQDVTDSEGR